jgi:hypothetical protein
MKHINIIIVNWNAGKQLADCINSINQYHDNLVESIIIVDNASEDDSITSLLKETSSSKTPIEVIRNNKNKGFGAACNQGATLATADYLLFLNPDTLLFENSLTIPYQFMLNPENEKTGICGIQLIEESGKVSRSCARFPTPLLFFLHSLGLNKIKYLHKYDMHMHNWAHDSTQIVDHVIGAFFLVHKELFNKLNGFDERYFVYLEDIDFSLRMKTQLGLLSIYLTDAQAFHKGGGTSSQVKAHRLFYSLRSRMLYAFKHFSSINAWLVMATTLLVEPITRILLAIAKINISDVKNVWNGYRMLISDMSNWFRQS